jgi:endonuclease G
MRFAGHVAGTLATAFAIGLATVEGPAIKHWVSPALSYFTPARSSDLAACGSQYPRSTRPAYVHKGIDRRTTTICYPSFSIGYSGYTRTPLWAAERLTAANVIAARSVPRPDEPFQPDVHLPGRDRATLDDYRRSGFDRGHMAPAGDMASPSTKAESFTLANIVPQNHDMNGKLWNDIEQATRNLARKRAAIYVVTGPVFEGAKLDTIAGRVAVPTSIYKAIYIPGEGAAAYVAANTSQRRYSIVSIKQLAQLTGIDPFPAIDASAKAHAIELPRPRQSKRRNRRKSRNDAA